jgi:hypothetical protein
MPASWRTSDLTVLAAAAAGTILLTTASFVVTPPDVLPRNDGSSYAPHPDGARAAYLLLQQLGYPVDRSFEPLAALRRDPEKTILVIAQPSIRPSDQDARALRKFIGAGGFVLITGPEAATFLPEVPKRSGTRASHPRRQQASIPGPLTAGVPEVELPSAGAPLPLDSPFIPAYGSYEDAAVLSARFDKGRVVWWAGAGPLKNGGIDEPGHVELFLNSIGPAGDRTVLWDEFYHGHTRSLWSYLAATPLPVALLQIAGLGGAALFTFTRRRRPVRSPAIEPRTSPLEFIDTMGGLYERARAANAAVATVRSRARRLLLEAAGLPPSTPDERLVTAAGERLGLGSEIAAVMARAHEGSIDPGLSGAQAVAIVSDLQELGARAQAVQRHRQRRS